MNMKTKTSLFAVAMSLATFTPVFGQPVITNQPQNQTALAGTTATFTVGATGVDPLSYQWRSYANPTTFTNIPFGTEATLLLTNVQPTTRRFAVMVTDSGGSATSSPLVTLTVVSPPVITNQPASQAGVRGYPITFRVGASGTAPFVYQWYFNATNLPGQTNASLMLPPVSDLNAGDYFVTVMNPYGAVTSRVARLTVGADIFTKVTEGPGSDVGYSRGAAWGDYDNDGFIDLFVANLGPGGSGSASHFLYHNNRNGTFSRVTTGVVAALFSAGGGAAWGDYDNDGNLDLILMNRAQTNYLFHNNGDGSFTGVPSSFSSDIIADSRSVTWVDYDNDGYVDLFRTAVIDEPRRLYHNNRDGTFTRITQGDLLTAPGGFFGVAWGDYNNDGLPDLFMPQSNEPSGLPAYLYRNDGGGTFTRVGAGTLDGTFNSNAAAWGDYDNDGDLDLFVSCAWPPGDPGDQSRPNLFYRNNGDGTFTSLTSLPANDPENQGGASAGCKWGDYDNDGWLDLFVANRFGQNNFLYHNNGDGTFTKITSGSLVNDGGDSWAGAWGDYDNDGFLDLFVGNINGGANFLYHNNGNDNHWLKFWLIGTRSNRAAIGAKVRVRATINGQSFWQMREVSGGDGLMGQNSLHVHFGLGDATNADLVRIEWPSGTVQELSDVASKQFLTVTEPGGEPRLAATLENGQVQLTLTGKQGSRYALETSTALPNWTGEDLTVTVTNQSGAVAFPAPGAGSGGQRFYRAVWQ
jgi:ASPIC and UnbV/FG-GAP-like repeat